MNKKRQAILDTSLQLFVEQGFHATPTAQIAKESGVATGTLFHYFKTKDELINTLYLETKAILIKAFSQKVSNQVSIKAKLKQFFLNAVSWAIQHPMQHLFYLLFSSAYN